MAYTLKDDDDDDDDDDDEEEVARITKRSYGGNRLTFLRILRSDH
jgi:hypothetical protein